MNDILDDLNSWLNLLVVERRYRQQAGEEPGADMDLVTRAIDEIASLRTTLAAKDASSEACFELGRRRPAEEPAGRSVRPPSLRFLPGLRSASD